MKDYFDSLQLLARGAPLGEVLAELCRSVESQTTWKRVSILLVDETGQNLVYGAAPNLPSEFKDTVARLPIGEGVGCCSTAVSRRAMVAVEDVETDPLFDCYRDVGRLFEFRSCWSLPIVGADDEILGAFVMYSAERRRPSGADVEAVERASHVAGITITLHRTTEALRESEQRFRDFAEVSTDWLWEIDSELRFTFLSDNFFEQVGKKREDVIGKPRVEMPPAIIDDSWKSLHKILRDRKPYSNRLSSRFLKDGSLAWLSASGRPIFSPDGEFLGYRGTAKNVTPEIEALRTLEHSEARYRLLFNRLPDAAYVHVEDTIVFVNEAAVKLFGATSEQDLIGRSAMSLYHPEDRALLMQRRSETVVGNEMSPVTEFRLHRLDGSEFYADGSGSLIDWDDGRAVLVLIRDISERKAVEQALAAAKETAEIANRTKSEFLANMSHELRTPLNAIIGFSEIMQNELLGPIGNEHYREYATDVNQSGNHLLALINDILDLSKIEAGKGDLVEGEFDPDAAIDSSLRLMQERAKSRNITLSKRIAEKLPRLRADERKVKQILLNLLSNAVKFTPEGGEVTVEVDLPDSRELAIRVRDTGIGIAAEDIPVALTPFAQLESSLSRRYTGTGLGLPLAKSLIELHGGSMEIESHVGKGTAVTIRFPAERLAA